MSKTLTGGCQCGRIRYAAALENDDAYLCHCRMCQRATGGIAAAFAMQLPQAAIRWEREPDWYQSSPIAHRAFCSTCGTPLGFAFLDGDQMDLTVGSFDDPSRFVPVLHSGAEGIHEAWLDTSALPRVRSEDTESVAGRWKAAGMEMPR
jgi:hypothetical protein